MRRKYFNIFMIISALVFTFWTGYFAKSVYRNFVLKNKKTISKSVKNTQVALQKKNHRRISKELKKKINKLRSIGYLSGYKKAGKKTGVTRYIRPKAFNALNLYVSAHAPEAILMNMKGKVLHKWRFKENVKKSRKYSYGHTQKRHWRRVHLFPNGDLLAIFEGLAMLKLDKNSNLLWVYNEGAHHDIDVVEDGKIYVLTREAKIIPHINKTKPILEDSITILSPDGKRLKRVSILKAFENSYYSPLIKRTKSYGDIFHTNTLEVFKGTMANISPLFRKGNVLISIRYLNAVAIVNMESERIEWCLSGMWELQHQPSLLDNGNILVFDNSGLKQKNQSRILEFNPFSQIVHWSYKGEKPGQFHSSSSGSVQRLPNGNTLVSESNSGRAFELTPDKKIVWEFFNPHRSWKDESMIATLFEMVRLDTDFPTGWLNN